MDGRFAVTAKTLLDALKELPEQPLTFEINTDSLEITVVREFPSKRPKGFWL